MTKLSRKTQDKKRLQGNDARGAFHSKRQKDILQETNKKPSGNCASSTNCCVPTQAKPTPCGRGEQKEYILLKPMESGRG